MRFARALPPDWLPHLEPGGALSFLLSDLVLMVPDDPRALDPQLRENAEVMVYHGTTRLVGARLRKRRGEHVLRFRAARSYGLAGRVCSDAYHALIGRDWGISDADELRVAYTAYLSRAVEASNRRFYRNEKEGWWQNRFCADLGRAWTGDQWLVIDREAVIGFEGVHRSKRKKKFYGDIIEPFERMKADLEAEDPARWGKPNSRSFGDELDLLVLGPDGELVCVELKHGENPSGIYWGAFQAAIYREAFERARPHITADIELLVRQKIRLRLLPADAEQRLQGSLRVEAALVVCDPNPRSTCWEKLDEVQSRRSPSRVPVLLIERGDRAPVPR